MIAVTKHDWNSTGLWCFDPEIRVDTCSSSEASCSAGTQGHLVERRAAAAIRERARHHRDHLELGRGGLRGLSADGRDSNRAWARSVSSPFLGDTYVSIGKVVLVAALRQWTRSPMGFAGVDGGAGAGVAGASAAGCGSGRARREEGRTGLSSGASTPSTRRLGASLSTDGGELPVSLSCEGELVQLALAVPCLLHMPSQNPTSTLFHRLRKAVHTTRCELW
eukprot:scaffold128423_cov66-Phaeocystis_antarctica.AAC.3